MGLSSSQARLLNLTTRMHQIEYKAAKIEAEKLQMANESDRVYQTYLDALDMTKIQRKKLANDGSVTYVDIQNYADFTGAGFALVFKGATFDNVTSAKKSTSGEYYKSNTPTTIAIPEGGPSTSQINTLQQYGITNPQAGETYYAYDKLDGTKFATQTQDYIAFEEGTVQLNWNELINGLGIETPTTGSFEQLLTNIINTGEVVIVTKNKNNQWVQPGDKTFVDAQTSVATNTNLQEVQDESVLRKAEAQYEADMKKIDRKERKFDSDLASLDNERNAIKQEMDTLKTVAKDNVERTFKLFS